MQDLHLVGFTKDHRHLIFSTRKDAKSGGYVVPVDDDLLEAVDEVVSHRAQGHGDENDGADEAPPSPPRVESRLSVREVQARLRAGNPAARIARDAGVDAEWVERFAQPIRAEQRRVVDRALAVPLSRSRAGESAVPLRRAIAAAMAERNVDFTAEGFEAAWSARLIGGSEWAVAFEFPNRGRARVLEWEFDIGSGTLTTSDRFASQLAFVEAADDLPPAEATVGAEATRVGSQMSRGPLTSGGLARPGSGRVTEPSTSATALPPMVRSAGSSDPDPQGRSPRPAPPVSLSGRPAAPRWSAPPHTDLPPAMPPRRPAVERGPEPPRSQSIEPPRRPPTGPASSADSIAPSRHAASPRPASHTQATTSPTADRPRQPMSTDSERPAAAPVPPRRPAPVAAPTNATRSHTRRPVPEIAPRMPVVIDADASDEAADRRALIEDEFALRDVVPSHPPGGRGESVVILRAVDEPSEADEPGATEIEPVEGWDGESDDAAEVDEAEWDEDGESEDDWLDDDEWLDDEVEDLDDVDADLEMDGDEDEDIDDALDIDADDELDDDQDELEEADLAEHDDHDDHVDADNEGDDAELSDRPVGADESRVGWEDDVAHDEDADSDGQPHDTEPESQPARATVRRSVASPRSRPRRLVARPESQPEADDDSDEPVPTRRPRSSVQFRPGSATQAGSGRSDASPNGRDDAADTTEEPDPSASTDAETEAPSRPRRRRRTEPLRAR